MCERPREAAAKERPPVLGRSAVGYLVGAHRVQLASREDCTRAVQSSARYFCCVSCGLAQGFPFQLRWASRRVRVLYVVRGGQMLEQRFPSRTPDSLKKSSRLAMLA